MKWTTREPKRTVQHMRFLCSQRGVKDFLWDTELQKERQGEGQILPPAGDQIRLIHLAEHERKKYASHDEKHPAAFRATKNSSLPGNCHYHVK